MLVSQSLEISKTFNLKNITILRIWTKESVVLLLKRFLLDEISYEEIEDGLDWLEDEYPRSRYALRRLRCCILLEEFLEYEQQNAIYASCFARLKLSLLQV